MASDTQHLTIREPVSPVVDLSADIIHVTGPGIPVTLTAANVAGGGNNALYVFAKDRNFIEILQGESTSNTFVMPANALSVGSNRIYVRMQTSELCYTAATAIDSIDIRRDASTGITDADYPGSIIVIYPNPFNDRVVISGLNNAEKYRISLYAINGVNRFSRVVSHQQTVEMYFKQLPPGIYFLGIYKEKSRKLLGTARLLKRQY